jgi:hypothetical protein
MVEINREHVEHLVRQNRTLAERVEALRERLTAAASATKSAVATAGRQLALTPTGHREHLIRTLEVNGAAFLGGLGQGKVGEEGTHFLGMPLEAWLGFALEAVGYFGGPGQLGEHAINLGDGFLASYTSGLGFHVGANWKKTGHLLGGKGQHPALAASNGATAVKGEISPHQIAQIVARVRGAAAMHGAPHGAPHG